MLAGKKQMREGDFSDSVVQFVVYLVGLMGAVTGSVEFPQFPFAEALGKGARCRAALLR